MIWDTDDRIHAFRDIQALPEEGAGEEDDSFPERDAQGIQPFGPCMQELHIVGCVDPYGVRTDGDGHQDETGGAGSPGHTFALLHIGGKESP